MKPERYWRGHIFGKRGKEWRYIFTGHRGLTLLCSTNLCSYKFCRRCKNFSSGEAHPLINSFYPRKVQIKLLRSWKSHHRVHHLLYVILSDMSGGCMSKIKFVLGMSICWHKVNTVHSVVLYGIIAQDSVVFFTHLCSRSKGSSGFHPGLLECQQLFSITRV